MRRLNKGIRWAAVLAVLLIALVFAALFAASRFIRLESVQNKIQTTVSEGIGGRVTFDRLDLTFFPRLGIEIHRPSLLLPEAAEGAAEAIQAYLSIGPLFLGRIELARIHLDRPDFTVFLADPESRPKKKLPAASVRTLDETVGYVYSLVSAKAPGLDITVEEGRLNLTRKTKTVFSLHEMDIRIRFPAVAATEKADPREFRVVAEADRIALGWERLPAPLTARVKTVELRPGLLSLAETSVGFMDSTLLFSGAFRGSLHDFQEADFDTKGSIGRETVLWLESLAPVPLVRIAQTPLTIKETRFRWEKRKSMELDGGLEVVGGPALSFNALRTPGRITVKSLKIQDRESQAELSLGFEKRSLDLRFIGKLSRNTLSRIFEGERPGAGFIEGDFRARVDLDRPARSTAAGTLRGENFVLMRAAIPVEIDRLLLQGKQNRLTVETADFRIADNRFSLKGRIESSAAGFLVDGDLKSEGIDWAKIEQAIGAKEEKEKGGAAEETPARTKPPNPVGGTLRFESKYISYDRFTVSTVQGSISLGPDFTRVAISRAVLCGLDLPWNLDLRPEELSLELRPSAFDLNLEATSACLWGSDLQMTGRFNLNADLRTTASRKDLTLGRLLEASRGNISFKAKEGRIHRFPFLARVLGFLNVTEILRGKLPDMGKDGLSYDTIRVKGDAGDGRFVLTECVLNGPSLNMAVEGEYRFASKKVDVMILVAPLKTVDAIVKRIPLLKDVLGGKLIAIPVQVKGPIADPHVKTLPASAIGKGLAGMLQRTLTLPFEIVEPLGIEEGGKKSSN